MFLLIGNAGLNTQAYQFRVVALVSLLVFFIVYFWEFIASLPKLLTASSALMLFSFVTYFVLSNKSELIARTNFDDRISQQKMGLSLFFDYPFFGVGADQMSRFIPLYLKPRDIVINGSDVVPDKTHNAFIDHLAHGGIFAGSIFAVFMVFSLVTVFQLMKRKDMQENRPVVALLSGIWIAYIAQQFISTDHVFLMVMPFMAFGLICKLNYSEKMEQGKSNKRLEGGNSKLLIRGIMSVALFVVSVLGGQAIYYDSQVKKILTRQIQNGDIALSTIQSFPSPKATEAIIVDAMGNLQNCPFAQVASDELLKIDNRSAQAWYVKALCADSTGDQKTALGLIDKAVLLQPVNLRYLEGKFRLTSSIGDKHGAAGVLERMLSINPNLPNLAELQRLLEVPALK
jgi:hypothetical protein